MIEVIVSRLGLDASTNSYVVILQERNGTRRLLIWIGQPEAESIVMHMHSVKRVRPLTHDLFKSLLVGMGAHLRRVHITRVEKSTYFAEMQIDGPEGMVQVDARPSDSIAIALRFEAPIYAPDELLTAIESDETGDDDDTAFNVASDEELSPEQLKAYLENLRPEDFGRFTP